MCAGYLRGKFEEIAITAYNINVSSSVNDFNSIALKYIASDNRGHAISCPDQIVGKIKVKKDGGIEDWKVGWIEDWCDKNSRCGISNSHKPIIAIVVESPHKDEFNRESKKAIGTARGSTGRNIENYLPSVLFNYLPAIDETSSLIEYDSNKQIQNGEYYIALINAIQYQCSLGEDTSKYRDKIFSEMWGLEKVKKDFIKRLKKSNPSVIINCCTRGNFKDNKEELFLRNLVQSTIDEFLLEQNNNKNILCLRAAHPSSVHFQNGLSFLKKI